MNKAAERAGLDERGDHAEASFNAPATGVLTPDGWFANHRDMSDTEPGGETPEDPSVIEKTQVPGTLIGYWAGLEKALIRLEDGRTIEAPAARQLDGRFTIGDAALVYFDGEQKMIGWLLADVNAGVNLRHCEEL